MILGSILDSLSDETVAVQAVVDLGDLGLLARLETVAAEHDLTLGETVLYAVNRFTSHADADSWVQLMSEIKRSEDPGNAALKHMLEASISRQ